jgi:hypothetical protein
MKLLLFKAMARIISCMNVQGLHCFCFTSSANTKWVPSSMDLIFGKRKKFHEARTGKLGKESKHSDVFTG